MANVKNPSFSKQEMLEFAEILKYH